MPSINKLVAGLVLRSSIIDTTQLKNESLHFHEICVKALYTETCSVPNLSIETWYVVYVHRRTRGQAYNSDL